MTLSPAMQELIDRRLKSGRYQTAEDVLAAALTTLDQQEQIADLPTSELERIYPGLRQRLADGLAAADAGRFVDGETFFDELEREEAANPSSDE